VLLTGGRSRRLGVDKARLLLHGESLASRAARVLAAVCDPGIEAGPGFTDLVAVREAPLGSGPLAALAAAGDALRERGHRGAVVALAVDLPRVGVPLLTLLAAWPGEPTAVPEASGVLQTTCARYGADALVAAGSLLAVGVRSLRALLDVVDVDRLDASIWEPVAGPDPFADVDTPADAARLGIRLPE